ncbi:alkaline phosphatase D family protein [Achromobacter aloeverae]|uniref:Metallophosphatase n=1 Tax=Achromobacter aloeverae TaxID=1750518 RepID=A0A4Q1HFC5_9BURK|nr:alkaline phosphatase D family protein [Achromobacter aloeverae]RXN85340.1 metallophosphatase [Achromobacter aloeverae]
MDRRRFLKWSGFISVSAVSPVLLTACGGDHEDDDTDAGAGADPGTGANAGTGFTLGVASGDPTPDSVILWTRVDGGSGGTVAVRVQVATDAGFTALVVDAQVSAVSQWDYTVRHKVTGLTPNTNYYYRFLTGAVTSTTGRTWTAPAADADVASLKFAFITCQDWNANHWGAFDALVNAEDPDIKFIVHVGDYIYERAAATRLVACEDVHPPLVDKLAGGTKVGDDVYATTIDDYRALYKTYRSDPRLQALHARYPFIAIWDDHEFSDDCWGDDSTYNDNGDTSTGVPQPARRRGANQAWYEYMLADVTFTDGMTGDQYLDIQIYRSFTFGKLATLVMTDERLYRADHLIPESNTGGSEIGSRYLVPQPLLQAVEARKLAGGGVNASVSMLGDVQRQWWKDQMSAANGKTTWKLWGNEVSLMRMQVDLVNALRLGPQLAAGVVAAVPALAPAQAQLATAIAADLKSFGTQYLLAKAQGGTLAIAAGDLARTQALVTMLADAPSAAAVAASLVSTLNGGYSSFFQYLANYLFDCDQWDGYDAERKALMAHLKSNGIQNVVALTGDLHAIFAGQVMDDYDAATPTPVMVDLMTPGISSTSLLGFYTAAIKNANHAFDAMASLVVTDVANYTGDALSATMKGSGSWIKYADTDAQGYAVVTLTPASLTCQIKKVHKLLSDGATAPTGANVVAQVVTATVAAGTPDVTVSVA